MNAAEERSSSIPKDASFVGTILRDLIRHSNNSACVPVRTKITRSSINRMPRLLLAATAFSLHWQLLYNKGQSSSQIHAKFVGCWNLAGSDGEGRSFVH